MTVDPIWSAFSLPLQSHLILLGPSTQPASFCHRPFANVWLFISLCLITFISFLDVNTPYFHFSLSGRWGISFCEICLYLFTMWSHLFICFGNENKFHLFSSTSPTSHILACKYLKVMPVLLWASCSKHLTQDLA